MNSVMEIGDNILFIDKGEKSWQGHRSEIFDTGNQVLDDFVFASELYKRIKTSNSSLSN
jgi:phospholipid/cholesterol/gamma-HCH transport system ATP-binding protein